MTCCVAVDYSAPLFFSASAHTFNAGTQSATLRSLLLLKEFYWHQAQYATDDSEKYHRSFIRLTISSFKNQDNKKRAIIRLNGLILLKKSPAFFLLLHQSTGVCSQASFGKNNVFHVCRAKQPADSAEQIMALPCVGQLKNA